MEHLTKACQRFYPFFISYHLLFALATAILIGLVAPDAGQWVARWPMNVPDVCVVIIFSLSGVTLKTTELHSAIKQPKALIMGFVLILFVTPLLGLAFMQLSGHMEFEEFVIGLATFTVVPTTVSAAVVIVGLVHGNAGLSLVLSAGTNIVGVFTVPFMLRFVIGAGDDMKQWNLLIKLCLTILVPVVGGKLLSMWAPIAALAKRHSLAIKLASSFFLVVIPWIKISKAEKNIAKVHLSSIFALIGFGILMHLVFLVFNYALCVFAKLPLPELKAVAITSSQKALATGVAIVAALPASMGVQGLIILPFIFSHFAQIMMDGFMVRWWNRRPETQYLPWLIFVPARGPKEDKLALPVDNSSTVPAVACNFDSDSSKEHLPTETSDAVNDGKLVYFSVKVDSQPQNGRDSEPLEPIVAAATATPPSSVTPSPMLSLGLLEEKQAGESDAMVSNV